MLKALEEEGHIDLESLSERMKKDIPNISLNTIYLNLEQLSKEELITKVSLNNQKSVYEIKKRPHIHLVCNICGAIEDGEEEGEIIDALKNRGGYRSFEPKFVSVNIYGVCAKCAQKKLI